MSVAEILVNGVVGSDTDVTIAALVQLNDNVDGTETTFAWTILDAPNGSLSALSDPAIVNPTFSPDSEGTYLIRLVVDSGLATECSDQVVVGVRHLKNLCRLPAAGETVEAATDGWAEPDGADGWLQQLDKFMADSGRTVAVCGSAGGMDYGDVAKPYGLATLKLGLPGQEVIGTGVDALASSAASMRVPLLVCCGSLSTGGAIALGELGWFKRYGLVGPITRVAEVVEDIVYVSDTGTITGTPGTNIRKVGHVVNVPDATHMYVWFDGTYYTEGVTQLEGTVQTVGAGTATALTITVNDNSAVRVEVEIVGVRSTFAEAGGYKFTATYRKVGGVLTQVGVLYVAPQDEDVAMWYATLAIVANNINVLVAGTAGSTINWRAVARIVQAP